LNTARKSAPFLAAAATAALAFALYHATLLADFDFGDTGFFQARVGSATLTPRDGYPLYFAIGQVFLWLTRLEPARALNLASAVEGAIACGLLVLLGYELSGSVLAAIASALAFAVSYTFWSQAIIAEVYALHAIFVALTTLVLLWWAARPTMVRLALFFGVYALGFGNHLSMILLLPGFAVFLLAAAPGGGPSMLRPRVVALALGLAAAGALQYAWNFRGLWEWPNHPPTLADAFRSFWFDVTKSDWRDTMVLQTPASMIGDRLAMYRFDVLQQFGWFALAAPIGLFGLFEANWRRGLLVALLYLVNVAFAFTYNVGDTHVFYLPSHLFLALLIAPAIVFVGSHLRRGIVPVVAVVAIAATTVRTYHEFPALDRSDDRRPAAVLSALTAGIDDRRAILIADLNWQLVNGLAYFGKVVRPDLAYAWMSHVLLYAPALIRDNLDAGRGVALTERAHTALANAYGPLVPMIADPGVATPSFVEVVRSIPQGTPYVLCVIRPSREYALDRSDLASAIRVLAGTEVAPPLSDYAAIVGVAGRPPDLVVDAPAPFRRTVRVDGTTVEVRMESWLHFDTIRRMGFGQVIASHHHTLIVERGVSFATFDGTGRATRTVYRSSIFAPQSRYLVRGFGG
jgi:hypothetical protein